MAQTTSKRKPGYFAGGGADDFTLPAVKHEKADQKAFSRINYYLMGGCLAMIIIGFLLMLGGGSSIEEGFNPDIFSTRRIVVGPAIAFLGFVFMAFAIIYRPKQDRSTPIDSSHGDN